MTQQNSYPIPDARLQVSNAYPADFDRMARLLDVASRDIRVRIPQHELAIAIGIADRGVKHLCALACAMGLLEQKRYRPTPFGCLVRQHDPFFDDLGTLWYVHYIVSSDPRLIIWHRLVNAFIPLYHVFTRQQAQASFADLSEWFTEYSVKIHVGKELRTALDAYTRQRLSRLDYLRTEANGFELGERESVPPLVLSASIALFRDRHHPGATAADVTDLLTEANSPGVVFQMNEELFREALETLKSEPGLTLESRADLDQVRLSEEATSLEWMRRYYESR